MKKKHAKANLIEEKKIQNFRSSLSQVRSILKKSKLNVLVIAGITCKLFRQLYAFVIDFNTL